MFRVTLVAVLIAAAAPLAHAQPSLPSSFHATTVHSPEGAEIYVRSGGNGPVVVLLHGYAENSDSWAPVASDLMIPQLVNATKDLGGPAPSIPLMRVTSPGVAYAVATHTNASPSMHKLLNDVPGVVSYEPQGAFYCFPSFVELMGRGFAGRTVSTTGSTVVDTSRVW